MIPRTGRILSGLSYPLLISAAVAGPLAMMSSGFTVLFSTYATLTAMVAAVILLELFSPARAEWKPGADDILNDSLFMVVVQMALPKMIIFLIVAGVTKAVQDNHLYLAGLWPTAWPVPLQALLMLLLADFFRYWLHRAAHANSWLWALHTVHHAPRILYWMNVGRFHPLEKALQICLDSLPFILIGVTEPVLAVYFVFYATNGFLQHSNIYLRHGPLNYVFSTAELHRWHHSRDFSQANCNFGNNLSIWDLLFQTWYLPEGRQVDTIGIQCDSYPENFVAQLKAPFSAATPSIASSCFDPADEKHHPQESIR